MDILKIRRIKYLTQCKDEKVQLEELNTVAILQRVIKVATCTVFGCTNSHKNSLELTFHRIPATNAENKIIQLRWTQNIYPADPLRKYKNFYACANHFENDCFRQDLKVTNFVSAYLTSILAAYKILKPIHQQCFLPPWLPIENISYLRQPWINNLPSTTYHNLTLAFSLLQLLLQIFFYSSLFHFGF